MNTRYNLLPHLLQPCIPSMVISVNYDVKKSVKIKNNRYILQTKKIVTYVFVGQETKVYNFLQ
jgi:hypothetical protein